MRIKEAEDHKTRLAEWKKRQAKWIGVIMKRIELRRAAYRKKEAAKRAAFEERSTKYRKEMIFSKK